MNQPIRVATKPSGKEQKTAQSNQRRWNSVPLAARKLPYHAKASMSSPQPTMIRKAKKGMIVGGRMSRGKSLSPTSFESSCIVAIRLPR